MDAVIVFENYDVAGKMPVYIKEAAIVGINYPFLGHWLIEKDGDFKKFKRELARIDFNKCTIFYPGTVFVSLIEEITGITPTDFEEPSIEDLLDKHMSDDIPTCITHAQKGIREKKTMCALTNAYIYAREIKLHGVIPRKQPSVNLMKKKLVPNFSLQKCPVLLPTNRVFSDMDSVLVILSYDCCGIQPVYMREAALVGVKLAFVAHWIVECSEDFTDFKKFKRELGRVDFKNGKIFMINDIYAHLIERITGKPPFIFEASWIPIAKAKNTDRRICFSHSQNNKVGDRKIKCALAEAYNIVNWLKEFGYEKKKENPPPHSRVPTNNAFLAGSRDEVG